MSSAAIQLRPYQTAAIDQTFEAWSRAQSVLGVAATGLGKTILFASILARHPGRSMVLAHREELIFQAADKIERVTGLEPDIEMAELRAAEHNLAGKARVVISTIQTQVAGRNGGRMCRFDPDEFDLLVLDESHHAVAPMYRKVIQHYRQNPKLRVLGVTATPDRADEQALGKVFDEVAFNYDVKFGIEQGWLVPIVQRIVHVDTLDLSRVRTTAGDLNGAELAAVMEYEDNLQRIAGPTIELTRDGRRTLVFAASVAHAERLCEILNRHRDGCAAWLCGKTPKDRRRSILDAYTGGRVQYLVNVDVATEGFDDPGTSVIVMARPTKSRAKYCQVIGRGTRPLPGTVDGLALFDSAEARCRAIAESSKPQVEVLDFVGNCGQHHLVTTADILGGDYTDDVVARARQIVEREGAKDMRKALSQAERELREERERARLAEAERRRGLVAGVSYRTSVVDPFDAFGITPWREKAWDKGRAVSPKMKALIERQGIPADDLTYTEARQLITEITRRWDSNECSYKQAKILAARGLPTNVTRQQAKEYIDAIAEKEGWGGRRTTSAPAIPPPPPPRIPTPEIVRY